MKRITLLVFSLLITHLLSAQDETIKQLKEEASKAIKKDEHDTTNKVWKKGGIFSLNIAQGSLSNWQGGGDKFSFSAVGFVNLFAIYKKNTDSWDNTLDIGYGYLNSTSLGTRKSDDRINLTSKYGHNISEKWQASALFDLRTQFTNGYNYTKDGSGRDVKALTSDFFAPAYVLLSLGFDYKPSGSFSLFLSPLTQRYIFVADDSLSAAGAYGVKPGSRSKSELGAFLSATFNKEIATNVTLKSKLDAFSNYKVEPQNVDIFWNNVLTMKVSRNLSTNIILDLLYDDDAIGRWQVRELLAIGITVKF
jgi:hypothetical protein